MTGEMFTVWTRDTSLVHLPSKRNTNIAITHGVVMVRAANVLHTLQDTYGDVHAEIHPVGEPPKAGTVGNPEAESKAVTAAAHRLGMLPGELLGYMDVLAEERRRVIKDG